MRIQSFLVLAFLITPHAGAAQAPASLGTAAGLGGVAVTEARRADALAWNPALLGVYDGPLRTTSLAALDARLIPGGDGLKGAARLGLLSGRVEDRRFEFAGVLPGASPDAAVQLRWVAVQSRGLALTLDTRFASEVRVPAALGGGLGIPGMKGVAQEDARAARSLTSVLAVGRGAYLGELPVLGRVWTGAAAKGWWVHQYARGSFLADLPAGAVYRETALGQAGGLGVDVGVAGLAGGKFWYAVSASNVYTATFRPGSAPRAREVNVVDAAGGGVRFRETLSPEIRSDDPDPERLAAARDLWEETRYPSVIRAGASWRAGWGTLSGAVSETLRTGGLEVARGEPGRTLAWQNPAGRFRASYGWGGSGSVLSAAVSGGRCDRRWTAGLRRSSRGGYGVAFDLSLSDWSCNLQDEGR